MNWIALVWMVVVWASDSADQKFPLAAFKEVRIEKPFVTILADQPLLMEIGGAFVANDEQGDDVVIGVGKCKLMDQSLEERERGLRVATLRARVAVVGELNGVRISSVRRVQECEVTTRTDRRDEKHRVTDRQRMTHERITGSLRGIRVVGAWLSNDGIILCAVVAQEGRK